MRNVKTTTISILAIGLLAGSAAGVAAQDEEATTSSFTGRSSFVELISEGTWGVPLPNGLDEAANNVGLHRWESSDPRLTGDAIVANTALIDPDKGNVLTVSTYELTNDGGSWLGEHTAFGSDEVLVPDVGNTGSIILVGRDGYDGLTAYIVITFDRAANAEFSGVIFPAAMPPFPELPAAE